MNGEYTEVTNFECIHFVRPQFQAIHCAGHKLDTITVPQQGMFPASLLEALLQTAIPTYSHRATHRGWLANRATIGEGSCEANWVQ